jgi:hypothetical protein
MENKNRHKEIRQPKATISSANDTDYLTAEIEFGSGAVIVSRDENGRFFVQTPAFDIAYQLSERVDLQELLDAINNAKLKI